jgi:hypothetical protein
MKLSDLVQANTHLLIVWETATHRVSEIEEDLGSRFQILRSFRVQWSTENVHKNMGRFYGKKLPDIADKVSHCGEGAFVVYFFIDPAPDWVVLKTSSGLQRVNRHVFEAKDIYREMTGGGHRVHATNNQSETLRDTVLLFGMELPETQDSDDPICRDLVGAGGWSSLTEMFSVMNLCTKYVVLRNFETLPQKHDPTMHGDIDLLCTDHEEFALLADAEAVFPQSYRRHYFVNIGGEKIPFDIRDVSENYYCARWSLDLIRHRVSQHGIYVPAKHDYVHSLAYHALMHKRSLSSDYGFKLIALFENVDQTDTVSSHMGYVADALNFFMSESGYRFVRPSDWSVYFNYRNTSEIGPALWKLVCGPPTTFKHLRREVKALLSLFYRQYLRAGMRRIKKVIIVRGES